MISVCEQKFRVAGTLGMQRGLEEGSPDVGEAREGGRSTAETRASPARVGEAPGVVYSSTSTVLLLAVALMQFRRGSMQLGGGGALEGSVRRGDCDGVANSLKGALLI